jgi:hypothetical protein
MLQKLQLAAYQQTIAKCSIFYVERGLITASLVAVTRFAQRRPRVLNWDRFPFVPITGVGFAESSRFLIRSYSRDGTGLC